MRIDRFKIFLTVFLISSSAVAMVWIYQVDPAICNGCGNCISACTTGALHMVGPNAVIDPELCTGCGDCVPRCVRGAIYQVWYQGIGETANDPLLAGPNPSSGCVTITGATPGSSLTVYDSSGRMAVTGNADSDGHLELDVSSLGNGLFFVLTNDGRVLPLVLLGE